MADWMERAHRLSGRIDSLVYGLQFLDMIEEGGISASLRQVVYVNRSAILVTIDLTSFQRIEKRLLNKQGISFKTISKCRFDRSKFIYPNRSTHLKFLSYLRYGYETVIAARSNEMIGYSWFVAPKDSIHPRIHPDLEWLDLKLGNDEVYLFDIWIKPEMRGRRTGHALLGATLDPIRQRGFARAYGYVLADNLPQCKNLERLGFKEVRRLEIRRILWKRRAQKRS